MIEQKRPDFDIVLFEYENWRGRTATRRVRPICVHFASTAWYTDSQWLLKAFDIDKGGTRDFSMAKMQNWRRAADEGVMV